MADTKTTLNTLYGHEAQVLRILTEWGANIDTVTTDSEYLPYYEAPYDAAPSGGTWTSQTSTIVYTCATWAILLPQLESLLTSNIIDTTSINTKVDNSTAESIAGNKTFTGAVYIPTGTTSTEAVTKAQLDTKEDTITGGASTIASADLTASKALQSNASGKVEVATTTSTELGYVNGVTSAIQTQLDAKSDLAGATFTGDVVVSNIQVNGNQYWDSTNDYIYYDSGKWWLLRSGCTAVQMAPVVFGTSATPPAGTYPAGTIYLEHDA